MLRLRGRTWPEGTAVAGQLAGLAVDHPSFLRAARPMSAIGS